MTQKDPSEIHQLKNHLSIILGFCDLLLAQLAEDSPQREDLLEMRRAGQAALDLLPSVAARLR